MKYKNIQEDWRKVGPIYRSQEAREIWYPAMVDRDFQRMEEDNVEIAIPPNTPETTPSTFDSCDWRVADPAPGSLRVRRGRKPPYWDFVCHGASHWLVNLQLYVAQQAEPHRPWRIVSSDKHSTVWDGDETLWDGIFLALGISPEEAWNLAVEQRNIQNDRPSIH